MREPADNLTQIETAFLASAFSQANWERAWAGERPGLGEAIMAARRNLGLAISREAADLSGLTNMANSTPHS